MRFPCLFLACTTVTSTDDNGETTTEGLLMSPCFSVLPLGSNPTVSNPRLVGFESGWLVSNPVGLVVNPGVKFLAPVPVCVTEGAST